MKGLLLWIACALALEGQSISITKPAANEAVTGYSGYFFQAALTAAPSVVKVCYMVDSYPAYNPGIDAPTTLGCSIRPPFSYPYNSFWNGNGPHQIVATAYDALGAVVATSAPVAFSIANTWPNPRAPSMHVRTSIPLSSNWSGAPDITLTLAGTGIGIDQLVFNLYVDGILQQQPGNNIVTGASFTGNIYTTNFQNGSHVVCAVVTDNTSGTKYSGNVPYVPGVNEWCATVNFENRASATNQTRTNAHDIYIAPGKSFGLTAKMVNTDGTLTPGRPVFVSSDTAVATVGMNTGIVTGVGIGNANIYAMIPNVSGNDLAVFNDIQSIVSSRSHPFNPSQIGEMISIKSGPGWTPSQWIISGVDSSNNAHLGSLAGTNCGGTRQPACPAAAHATGGTFELGPTSQDWAMVWPTNTTPCFAGNGTIHTSYSDTCFVMHSMFNTQGVGGIASAFVSDQPYNPGAAADFAASAINTFEPGFLPFSITGNENPNGFSTFHSQIANYISKQEGFLANVPNAHVFLVASPVFTNAASLWGSTYGAAASWPIPPFQDAIAQWSAYGNVTAMNYDDEIPWGPYPLQGPIVFNASGTGQSWLKSLTASGGGGGREVCTANTSGWAMNAASSFIVHGSKVANMNNVPPAVYKIGNPKSSNLTFSFGCPNVTDGTYNSKNDPGFTLEPLAASWVGPSNNQIPYYDMFAKLWTQAQNVSPRLAMAGFPIGLYIGSGPKAFAGWAGNTSVYTQRIGSVTRVSDYGGIYPETAATPFLISRLSAHGLLATGNIAQTLRVTYGFGYSPSTPLVALTTSDSGNYWGIQGTTVPVASCSGTLLTFRSPHGIANIIPGMTRLSITGATDSGTGATDSGRPQQSCNNRFVIWNCPTSTTCNVTLAATDRTANANFSDGPQANSGVITFQDGSSVDIAGSSVVAGGMSATGTAMPCYSSGYFAGGEICADLMTSRTIFAELPRKRGQTFSFNGTAAGAGASYFNANTFLVAPESLDSAVTTSIFYRQIPVLSATGGTATIIADNNVIKGPRNGSQELIDRNPGWAFGDSIECIYLRCAGERMYGYNTAWSGYSSTRGFTAAAVTWQMKVFGGSKVVDAQLFMNQHFENGAVVPYFHAHNYAALIWDRLKKYWLQPRLNTPDYGPLFDCGAAAGSYGNVMSCLNATDGPQTVTFDLTPYLQGGQQIIRYIVNDHSLTLTTINPGKTTKTTDPVTLQPLDAVFYVFPAKFAGELQQPAISARLADVKNATKIVVRYAYDRYYLDSAGNTYDCGAGACTPAWDRNVGTLYYRLIYLGPHSEVLATSDVQTP